jgi:molecular chaperone IbpA
MQNTFNNSVKDFEKFFIGYDGYAHHLTKLHQDLTKNAPNYPPYNIKKIGENTYTIELAVAGFNKQQLEIHIDGDKLSVKGNIDKSESSGTMLYEGIANRAFTRAFALNDNVVVKNAGLFNGMLKIMLEQIIPEKNKSYKIDIQDDEPQSVSEFASGNIHRTGEQVFGPGSN